ncbi:MAG TPA: DinB family protein [Pyrinomonadaceae bacterium]|jgi:uncharacterized damage-inducible protein DinB
MSKVAGIEYPMHNPSSDVARAFIDRASRFLSTEYLPKIERCLEQLTDEQIWFRPNQASNSIGNLVLHLCGNARQWIVSGLGDNPDCRDRDSEFNQREVIPRVELLECLRATVGEVGQVLADLDSSVVLERRTIQGKDVDILEAIFHVTEHFSMHTGQIILLTKMLAHRNMKFYEFSSGVPVNRWNT